MYRSMAELATHCRRVRLQWVTVTVALLRNGLTNRSLHIAGIQEDDERTWRVIASLARCTREEPARFVTRHRRIPKANQLRRERTERSEPLDANGDCSGSRYSVARPQYPAPGGRI